MIDEEKQRMRKCAFALRDALPLEVRQQKSHEICDQLGQHALEAYEDWRAQTSEDQRFSVAVYHEIKAEVRLHDFREFAWVQGWRVCFPCVETPGFMVYYALTREVAYRGDVPFIAHPGRSYSREDVAQWMAENDVPVEGCCVVEPEELTFVVVPLVGFATNGARLGYGGGNYDRYVPRLAPNTPVVGVAFAEQRLEDFQPDPWDCKMDYIVTA